MKLIIFLVLDLDIKVFEVKILSIKLRSEDVDPEY